MEDTINDIIDKSIAEDIKDEEIDVTIEDTIEDKSDCFGEDIIIDKIGKSIGEDIKENTEDTVDGMCEVVRKFLTKKNLFLVPTPRKHDHQRHLLENFMKSFF